MFALALDAVAARIASELSKLLVRVETPAITAVYELTVDSPVEAVVLKVERPETDVDNDVDRPRAMVAVDAAAIKEELVAKDEFSVDTVVDNAVEADVLVDVAVETTDCADNAVDSAVD